MKRNFFRKIIFPALTLFLLCGSVLSVSASEENTASIKLNIDKNDDGTPDLNIDTDGDGFADINVDQDGDGIADLNVDIDNDLLPDLNTDIDGDEYPDLNIDTNGDRYPDSNIDSDFNGIADIWFTEGTNATFYLSSNDGLVFGTDGDYEQFQGLLIDGVTLTDDEFASIEGGTIVQVFSSYLRTLSEGQHQLTFVYPGENVSCYFYVAEDTFISRTTEDVTVFMFWFTVILGIIVVIILIVIWKIATRNLYNKNDRY